MSSDAEMRKGAGEIWDSVQDGGCKIITSVITLVEIKGKHIKHNLEQYKKFYAVAKMAEFCLSRLIGG